MQKLFDLYQQLYDDGTLSYNEAFTCTGGAKAATIRRDHTHAIFINAELIETTAEETCVIAHECGHIETGTTHGIYSPLDLIERHEYRANKWAVKRLLPKSQLVDAITHGTHQRHELAELFNVTEDFISLAIEMYRLAG